MSSSFNRVIMYAGCVLWLMVHISVITNPVKAQNDDRRLSDVDPLLKSIELEQWGVDEAPCVEAMLAILHGVKNSTLWATWIWDSMQRPVGFLHGSRYQLGSFDQCLKPPWLGSHAYLRTQYCLADVRLTDATPRRQRAPLDPYATTSSYFERTSNFGRFFNVLTWGVCLPNACSQGSVHKMLQAMLRTQHLPPSTLRLHITIDSCQQAGDPIEYSLELKAFLLLLVILTLVPILAMLISGYTTDNSLGSKFISSFDLKRNWNKYLEKPQDEVASVNGIKCICSMAAILVHYILFVYYFGVFNNLDIEKDINTTYGAWVTHIEIGVDTFIFISGLLLMKGLYRKRKNPVLSLIKRYIRMLVPLAVTIFYFTAAHVYTGSGPLWPRFSSQEKKFCTKNWWTNILMVNNLVKCDEMCHLITWYIAVDFQLVAFGSVLYYVYQKNHNLGKWLFGTSFVIAALLPAFLTYQYEMPAILAHDMQKMNNIYNNEVFVKIYIKSYCRAAVYMLGMLLGNYMCRYNPAAHRNTVSMKWSILGVGFAGYVMCKLMAIGGSFSHKEYDLIEATIFVVFDKTCWALAIGVLIFVCEYGHAPIISNIFHFKPFGAASKLCYGMYLIQTTLMYRTIHYARTPRTSDLLELVVTGIGMSFFLLPFALYMYLFIESPVMNLTNLLFRSEKSVLRKETDAVNNRTLNGSKLEEKFKVM